MAGRIRDEDLALVRERSAVEEVIGEYLQLRNAGGGSLKGLCPFHDEKTPSFNVTPSRGMWYCFSCHEGGDVITFVQKIDNLSFTETIERLASRAGIDLRYEQAGSSRSVVGCWRRTGPRPSSTASNWRRRLPPMGTRSSHHGDSSRPTGSGSASGTRRRSGMR
jgi:DNA primase